MYFIADYTAHFRVGLNNVAVGLRKIDHLPGLKHIKVNSYIREGRVVSSSIRAIKPGKNITLSSKKLKNTKPITVGLTTLIPRSPSKTRAFSYFNSEYNRRFNYNFKTELNAWKNNINNMKVNKAAISDWDDAKSIVSYIEQETSINPSKFRSISVNGKVGAMATVTNDVKNKALYVENLVANPNKLHSAEEYSGAGTTMLLHLIEESFAIGHKGKLTLSSLPGAVKFYRKLGFTSVGHPLNFKFELSPKAAQKLLDTNLELFKATSTTANFSSNIVDEAMDLENTIIGFAIKRT